MFHESPAFPQSLAFGATGGPGFLTQVVQTRGTDEQRNQCWSMPLYGYEVELLNKPTDEVSEFLAFYHAVAQGQLHGFRFRDPLPGESVLTDEPLGVGTGSPLTFQLIKRYTSGVVTFDRIISKPVNGTMVINFDGTPTLSYSLDYATGFLTSTPGSGVVVTASGVFDVPCQFRMPAMRLEPIAPGIWSWPSIQIIETRTII